MTVSAVPALLTPIILLMGIYTGIMTATEPGQWQPYTPCSYPYLRTVP